MHSWSLNSKGTFLRRRPTPWAILFVAVSLTLQAAELVSVPSLGLRVARGFRVTVFAEATMADDVYAMTVDPRGNVVVTSQGYIRTLHDDDHDGVADGATDFAVTLTGGMGLCFNGPELWFVGDGALWRFLDTDADGRADGPADRLLTLRGGEHGAHAVRKGPDGWWYLIGGNDTGFDQTLVGRPSSLIRPVEAGALLRLSPDGQSAEAVAHGFRNPYDFDFNAAGDLFTYDSDVEADLFLPWYTPTCVYHVAPFGHHGWRLPGHRRSWRRTDYYADTVEVAAPMGRGSPTGVACYRHYQFPPYYRDGLFVCDWTFGKVHYLPLQVAGSSYTAAPEVFLEAVGTQGFAPTDVAVAPDGSLLISIGGRKTRGAIYRVQFVGDEDLVVLATNWLQLAGSELDAVLLAPQPQEAWSRFYWVPMAQRLGSRPFEEVVLQGKTTPEARARCLEILTELHGGLPTRVARFAANAPSPLIRSRTAWSLGRIPCESFQPILLALARDSALPIRRSALEAMDDRHGDFSAAELAEAIFSNLSQREKRLRQAAARLAGVLPEADWNALWLRAAKADVQTRLTATLALLWRSSAETARAEAITSALSVLNGNAATEQRLQAIRLIMLALGDWRLQEPALEAYTAYQTALPPPEHGIIRAIVQALKPLVGSGDAGVDFEAARLLAMLEPDDPTLPSKVIALLRDRTSPTSDFHYITVLSRLKAKMSPPDTTRTAQAILGLDRKLAGQQARRQQNWPLRLAEVVQALISRTPALAEALLRHQDFPRPAHLGLVSSLGSERHLPAARRYLAAVRSDPMFPWSAALVDLLSALPDEEVRPLFRAQWSNPALRDGLLRKLAERPEMVDRDKFIAGLASLQLDAAQASMSALLQLPAAASDAALAPAMQLLRRLLAQPQQQAMRVQAVALLAHLTGEPLKAPEQGAEGAELRQAYQPIFHWFVKKYPLLAGQLEPERAEAAQWNTLLRAVRWDRGEPRRGEQLFRERGCQTCHAAATPLGPDLAGVAARLSPLELMQAVVFPNREVAEPYRMITVRTRNGQTYTGSLVFEAPDGVLLRTSTADLVRLAESDIASRQSSDLSPMPTGLLDGLGAPDLADLYAYLRTLPPVK